MTPRPPAAREHGVTLAEMLVTVALVALAASLAVPSSAPAASFAADAVAGEVSRAIRFAQREAVRTGVWHAARFDVATQTLKVYRLKLTGGVVEDLDNPVFHPVDKNPYEVRFANAAAPRGRLASADFKFKSRPLLNYVSFGPDGVPADISGSTLTVNPLESNGKVVISLGHIQREVVVARVTGRVTF